ncbi:BrnA antitoxin family protein [Stenotrophomonas maltophilia]|uniref:BrnA antitoxin family protein n=1 Tax=Stenotrophomonas maltophilia TaxID=40324 RepID=UPI0021C9B045|nr:BrnA antitoxin family protein [Stenotrophomonas maltophilia]MCU0996849.1 hypothetical protein [Stenotrophomonas maltophilia]
MNSNDNECRWESGEFGLSEQHAVAAPASVERDIDEALALQMISIRLPKQLINDLKLIAPKEGLGYQPLIRRVLQRFVEGEFRNMAYDDMLSQLNAPELKQAASEDECTLDETPRRVAYG